MADPQALARMLMMQNSQGYGQRPEDVVPTAQNPVTDTMLSAGQQAGGYLDQLSRALRMDPTSRRAVGDMVFGQAGSNAIANALSSPAANDALSVVGGIGAIAGKSGIYDAYHGTGKVFDAFASDAPKTTGGGLNDKGFFFSADPKTASRFTEFGGDAPNVRMHKLQMNKPLEMTASEFERMQDVSQLMRHGKEIPEVKQFFLQDDLANAGIPWENGHPIDAIKSAGYDGIIKQRGKYGADQEYMVFDPSQILPKY